MQSSPHSYTPAASADTRPPTILQVLPALGTGGVERTTVDITRALVEAGARALVTSAGGAMVHEVERAGGEHILLPLDTKNPFTIRANAARIATLAASHGVDLIHARSRAPAWSAWMAARRLGRPFVTTFHGTYSGWNNPLKRAYNAIMTRGDTVIANSQFTADHIITHYHTPAERIAVIPRGVNMGILDPTRVSAERIIQLARSWALPDGLPVVMLPGRLTRWKGQLVLIEAVARLKREGGVPEFCCLLVGDDQGRSKYRDELFAAIKAQGLDGTVRVVGHCRDMAAAYMLADVVVSASTDPEAFGRVSAEAQAMGRPVVATGHGGSREIILDGVTGMLVAPGDADALAAGIRAALDLGAEERNVLAARAREHVAEHFTVEGMCDATLRVYGALLVQAEEKAAAAAG